MVNTEDNKAIRSSKRGQVYIPTHPCYKHPEQLCALRELPDSKFGCLIKTPELCRFGFVKNKSEK